MNDVHVEDANEPGESLRYCHLSAGVRRVHVLYPRLFTYEPTRYRPDAAEVGWLVGV